MIPALKNLLKDFAKVAALRYDVAIFRRVFNVIIVPA